MYVYIINSGNKKLTVSLTVNMYTVQLYALIFLDSAMFLKHFNVTVIYPDSLNLLFTEEIQTFMRRTFLEWRYL